MLKLNVRFHFERNIGIFFQNKNRFDSFTAVDIGKKLKLSLCLAKHHAMKTYLGSGGTATRIL
jgi:hypothetical protein